MDYFYAPPEAIAGETIVIEGDEFRHLTHVMRKKKGDQIIVTNGCGQIYHATVDSIIRKSARCTCHETRSRVNEHTVLLTLAVALLKNPSRFDIMIEKTTELGVHTIVPIITKRTIAMHGKIDRWQKIALGAMKQSLRCVLPQVSEVVAFPDFLVKRPEENKFIPHQNGERTTLTLPESVRRNASICVCIGPEGGFTEEEVEEARAAGFQPVSLGARRLRAETAAIYSVATLLRE